jgi:hypothetical protein
VYFFGGWVWSNFLLTYILLILLLAFDFWTVKNITGRKLVGLRWWNFVKEDADGNSVENEWVFESISDPTAINSTDRTVFWYGT